MCHCMEGFNGPRCENYVKKERIQGDPNGSFSPAAIVIPLLLVLIVTLGGAAFYVFLRKRNLFGKQIGERGFGGIRAFGGGGSGSGGGSSVGSSVVSFRQGSNVEFTNPALVSTSHLFGGKAPHTPLGSIFQNPPDKPLFTCRFYFIQSFFLLGRRSDNGANVRQQWQWSLHLIRLNSPEE